MKVRTGSGSRKHERGISLLETLFAAAVMLVGIAGVMALFTVAAMKNVSQGSQTTRCTDYAQDKMEQLMALSFSDTTSNTTQVPTAPTGGPGLAVGSSPTVGYFDYVTEGTGTGAAIYPTVQTSSAYKRQWTIALTTDPNIKTITVTVTALQKLDTGAIPTTTLVSQKTFFSQP
jgi:Tfp pilus assembly protein PilV